jgi:hypothetical protein
VWGDNVLLTKVEAWLCQTDADVVLLQEIPPSYADRGIPSLKDVYPHQLHQFIQSWPWGNFLISRYPFIVAGDFNICEHSVIYGELAARMADSFREAGTGFGTSWPLPVAKEIPVFVPPLVRIDYIWHSKHFRAIDASQGPRLGSDHLPLFATLELILKSNGVK